MLYFEKKNAVKYYKLNMNQHSEAVTKKRKWIVCINY